MGVDAELYILPRHNIDKGGVIAALAKAAGCSFDGENIHVAEKRYYRCRHEISCEFGEIVNDDGNFLCFIHTLAVDSIAPGSIMLSARSHPDALAWFRTVADAIGGLVIWADSTDEGRLYSPPDNKNYTQMWEVVEAIKPAQVIPEDIEHAAYGRRAVPA